MTKHDDITPRSAMRALQERSEPWLKLGWLLVTFAGGVVWATLLWRDVQDLKRDIQEVKAAVRTLVPSAPLMSKVDQ